ncbi:FHA domain-containing protein [Leucothrix sargassi]|nr:FHA domain-containing protein [Leucothrix sargassi]
MAKLILEVLNKGRREYHKVDSLPVTVGRALDNDIIVSDITVSPYHLKIDEVDGRVELNNLSDENGTEIDRLKVDGTVSDLALPAMLRLGDLKVKVLAPDTAVAPTQRKASKTGLFAFLNNPFWAWTFVVLSFLFTLLGKFIRTPVTEEPWVFVSKVLPALLVVFLIALLITCVSRLSTHRWTPIPALSIAALFILLPQVFAHAGRFLDYYLTSSLPSSILENISNFLLVPLLLCIYLIRVHYLKFASAISVAALATMPIIAFFLVDLVTQVSNKQGFSPMPSYNKSLSSSDIRAKSTMSVDDFIDKVSQELDQSMAQRVKESTK